MATEWANNNKQYFTQHYTQKTNDRTARTPTENRGWYTGASWYTKDVIHAIQV